MFGAIKGIVRKIYDEHIIVEVSGIGYIIFLAKKLIQNLKIDEQINVLIETRFKVDKICLFGFLSEFQQKCFNYISSISGVSDKIATEIAGTLTANEFLHFIKNDNKNNTIKINGVGTKTWEKILFSLGKNKNFYNDCLKFSENDSDSHNNQNLDFINHELYDDGLKGLIAMGINKNLAKNLIQNSLKSMEENSIEIDLQNLIKESLKSYNMSS